MGKSATKPKSESVFGLVRYLEFDGGHVEVHIGQHCVVSDWEPPAAHQMALRLAQAIDKYAAEVAIAKATEIFLDATTKSLAARTEQRTVPGAGPGGATPTRAPARRPRRRRSIGQ